MSSPLQPLSAECFHASSEAATVASTIASTEPQATTHSLLDAITSLRADTDAIHSQMSSSIRKQQLELDHLLQAQQRLQHYHASVTNALLDFIKCMSSNVSSNDLVDGAVVHAAAAATATVRCVGKPDLTNEALKIYTLATNKDERKRNSTANNPQQRTPLNQAMSQAFHGAKRGKNDPTLRSLIANKQQAPPVSVLPILQNLLGCSTWKKTLQFVNTARGLPAGDTRGLPVGDTGERTTNVVASVAGRALPGTTTGVNSKILERLVPSIFSPTRLETFTPASPSKPSALFGAAADAIRAYLQQEILKRGRLIGRDDHLFVDVFEGREGKSKATLRAEIIAVDSKHQSEEGRNNNYFNTCTRPIKDLRPPLYETEIDILLDWAEAECTKIGRPDFSGEGSDVDEDVECDFWDGSIEDLQLDLSPSDKQGSMRFIQLASSDRSQRTDAALDEFAQNVSERGWMSSRWVSIFFGNGLWKAELLIDDGSTRSCYQKSLKQASYQKAQHRVLGWLCKNAQRHNIRSFRYKSKGEECSFLVPSVADRVSESEEDDELVQRKRMRLEASVEATKKRRQSSQGLT